MSKVVVVGGGAAGMFASVFYAKKGNEVHVLEKNEKLGKKLYITGKGRCNITNACDTEDLFNNVISNKKFLYSAFYTYNNHDVMNFFEEEGLKIKVPIPVERSVLIGGGWHCISQDQLVCEECASKIAERLVDL